MRVEPPTNTISSTSFFLISARFKSFLIGLTILSTKSYTKLLNSSRVISALKSIPSYNASIYNFVLLTLDKHRLTFSHSFFNFDKDFLLLVKSLL